jgi:hypothetical protein
MAHALVDEGRAELWLGQGVATQPRPDLAQAEQLEVVDQEGA